jgi:hypothetical protein
MHRQAFERRAHGFVHSNAYTAIRHDDVEAGKRLWIAHVHKHPPIIRWGALIGDCLFNFRSALDQLAYDLAVAHNGSPLDEVAERQSEFPIFWERKPRKSELDRKIGTMHPDARKLIEAMQPYGRKDRAALKYLDRLHNFDKHRTLHLVAGVSTAIMHFGEIDFEHINFSPFEHGDVLARIPLSSDPERQQDPLFSFGVAFSEAGPGATAPNVATTLGWIGQHIEERVIPPLLPYL